MRVLFALAVALLTLIARPSSSIACDAMAPTFEQTIEGAEVIVLGRVSEVGEGANVHGYDATIDVIRVLRGQPGETLLVTQPAYLCGDGLTPADVGRRVLVATDVQFGVMELSPYWYMHRGELEGWTVQTPAASSLDELADRIAIALPDTATHEAISLVGSYGASLVGLVGLAALVLFVIRPLGRARRRM